MKRLACALTLSVLAGLLWPPPVLAATTYTDPLQGVEVSPGLIIGKTRFGATFVGIAGGQLPGTWAIAVNYTPPRPGANVTNTLVTGTWELTVYQNGRPLGRLFGKVANGKASWSPDGTVAALSANLTVTGGTGVFAGARGTGTFTGTLSHLFFPPRIGGTLQLAF
jgi:hypothetical protein